MANARAIALVGLAALGVGSLFFGKRVPVGKQVSAELTPIDEASARTFLRYAFLGAAGREPTDTELAMLMAHSAQETARWTKMHRGNFGNLVALRSQDFYVLEGNPRRFQAFEEIAEGADAFVSLIKRRYPKAWAALATGDTTEYAQALADGGYYGDHPVESVADVAGGFARYLGEFHPASASPEGA